MRFIGTISNTRDSVLLGYNTDKRVENTTACSGVFVTKFEVFAQPATSRSLIVRSEKGALEK